MVSLLNDGPRAVWLGQIHTITTVGTTPAMWMYESAVAMRVRMRTSLPHFPESLK